VGKISGSSVDTIPILESSVPYLERAASFKVPLIINAGTTPLFYPRSANDEYGFQVFGGTFLTETLSASSVGPGTTLPPGHLSFQRYASESALPVGGPRALCPRRRQVHNTGRRCLNTSGRHIRGGVEGLWKCAVNRRSRIISAVLVRGWQRCDQLCT